MNCVSCRREIADASNFCPYCGSTQGASPSAGTAAPSTGTPVGGVRAPAPQGTYSVGGQPSGAPMAGPSQRATMSMVLGIASVVFSTACSCCYGMGALPGIGLGIAAFIMGRNELEDIAAGFASPAGQSNANLGKTLGLVGGILGGIVILAWIGIFAVVAEMGKTTY